MKTEQEQTRQMLKILCDKFQCSAIDRSYMAKSCRQCEDIIEALHEAGYGNVSEYKAEIERLEQLDAIQCDAWQKLSDENERLVTENNSNLRYNAVLRKENKKLKEEIEQAKIDVLNELKERLYSTFVTKSAPLGDITVEDIADDIDELIKEVQNAEDKG